MPNNLTPGLFETPGFWEIIDPPRRPRRNTAKAIGSGRSAQRAPKDAPRGMRAKLAKFMRVISRTPEVLVKITGTNRDAGGLKAHLEYLTKKDAARAENERGQELNGKDEVLQVMKEWGRAPELPNHEAPPNAIHVVLSMPKATDAEGVLRAAREFAADEFGNHQYLLVLHTDRDHPHVHAVVNPQGFDQTRLKRKKADLQRWRERFAAALRAQGIAAEATPRQARGVVRKGKTRAMYQMEERAKRSGKVDSRVLRARIEEAANELSGATESQPRPWENKLAQKREVLMSGLRHTAQQMAAHGEDGARVSATIRAFIESLPPLETERDVARKEVANAVQNKGRPGPVVTTER